MKNLTRHVLAIARQATIVSALALAATGVANAAAVPAGAPSAPVSTQEAPVTVALAGDVATESDVSSSNPVAGYPSIETGVRRAANQGPEALRRYISRTRMIYGFYFPDFVKNE